MLRLKSKCKVCRRYGEKMFMKGERDIGQKCAHIRRGTKPGAHGKKRGGRRKESEFGNELAEKQKLRYTYGLTDTGLRKVFAEAAKKPGKTTEELVQLLERRLDNVVFRAGFTVSRGIARHIVSHGHIMVNGRRVTIPSYRVKPGDVVSVRPESAGTGTFVDLAERLKKYEPLSWLELDREARSAKVKELPKEGDLLMPGRNLRLVVEFYSK